MIIKRVKIKNFNSIENLEIDFDKINLITGLNKDTGSGNGVGKSSIIEAILFALYGSNGLNKSLKDIVQKGKNKTTVELEIEKNDATYKIVRTYPTSIEIYKNNEKLDFANNLRVQEFIDKELESLEIFKKFRIVDKSKEINILEFTPTQLRETLLGFLDDEIIKYKEKLLELKRERELYQKSNVVYTHYPSERRLEILSQAKKEFQRKIDKLLWSIKNEYEEKLLEINDKSIELKTKASYIKKQALKLKSIKSVCPLCKQKVSEDYKKSILKLLKEKYKQIKKLYTDLDKKYKQIEKKREKQEKIRTKKINYYTNRRDKIMELINRLETRIKQKDYKYSEKDILIVKEAILELEKFFAYVAVEYIKSLEPIINSYILDKLNLKIEFCVQNAKIDIILERGNTKLHYKNLSSGEKLFLSIIFKLAILIQQNLTGIIIADEGLDSLSNENIESIIEIIKELPYQLIFISHHFISGDINTIYLIKEKGVTNVGERV